MERPYVGQAECCDDVFERVEFFSGGIDERDAEIGSCDGERDAGDTAAGAEVGERERCVATSSAIACCGREVGQERERVGDVFDVGLGSGCDPGEVEFFVPLDEQIEKSAELIDRRGCRFEIGGRE